MPPLGHTMLKAPPNSLPLFIAPNIQASHGQSTGVTGVMCLKEIRTVIGMLEYISEYLEESLDPL